MLQISRGIFDLDLFDKLLIDAIGGRKCATFERDFKCELFSWLTSELRRFAFFHEFFIEMHFIYYQ